MPTYTTQDDLVQAVLGLHMSDILGYDDDDEDGPNDIEISRKAATAKNDDYTMGGSIALQRRLRDLIEEYGDIFSYLVKKVDGGSTHAV